MSVYFARCLRGLERIAQEEISQLTGASLNQEEIRTLFFRYEGNPADLLGLRCVDDVFFHLGEIKDLDHTRATLYSLPESLEHLQLSFDPYIQLLKEIRNLSNPPSYTLTVGLQGKKNFSRFEIATQVLPIFEKKLSGQYIPNQPGSAGADLDFRLLMEGNALQLGLRLSKQPLHRRPYKRHNLPGSTKPPLAYVLAKLAEIQAGDVVLDPCCGVGTLLIEAALAFPAKTYMGNDINEESIALAVKNAEAAQVDISFMKGDAKALAIPAASVDKIISNPPWGRQVSEQEDLAALYKGLFTHSYRLLKVGARMVLLTDRSGWMNDFLETSSLFLLLQEIELSLFGSIVKIYVLKKR